MAIIIAIIVTLQMVATFIRIGSIPVSLVLVPIVVGAAMYGSRAGAVLGAAFGIVVLINCINGLDLGGHALWVVNPPLTAALCLIKGTLAGYVAGVIYSLVSKKYKYFGVAFAAVACPVVNTGIFITAMYFFYRDMLILWAGGSSLLYFSFVGLAGLNFLFEFGTNLILVPGIVRIINAVKR